MTTVAVCWGRQQGKSELIKALRDAGYEVVDEQQLQELRLKFETAYSGITYDELIERPTPEPYREDRTPDWKRKKYFGNHRR